LPVKSEGFYKRFRGKARENRATIYTFSISKDNEAAVKPEFQEHSELEFVVELSRFSGARRRLRRRITNTSRKPTTLPTKLAVKSGRIS